MAQQQLMFPQLPLPAALNAPLSGVVAPGPVPYGPNVPIPDATLLAEGNYYKNIKKLKSN
jgi:hypothetical protein